MSQKIQGLTFGLRLKQHMYFIALSLVTLVLFWTTGFFLMGTNNPIALVDKLPTVNSLYLLLWRLVFYCILISIWKPLMLRLSKTYHLGGNLKKIPLILACRRKLVLAIVLVELFIVQNLFGRLLQWILGGIYGS